MKCHDPWPVVWAFATVMSALAIFPGHAGAAAPAGCAGTIQITPAEIPSVRIAGPQTFVSFDFVGTHDLCLADGSFVTGNVVGHAVQRVTPDGDMTLRFDEILSVDDGTLHFRGQASLHGTNWQSAVRTVGTGSGVLAGIEGQGSFYPTADPSIFYDVIDYVYR